MKVLKPEEPAHGAFHLTDEEARALASIDVDPATGIVNEYKTNWWSNPGSVYQPGDAWVWIEVTEQMEFENQVSKFIVFKLGRLTSGRSTARRNQMLA